MNIRKAKLSDCKQIWELCKTKELVNPGGIPPRLWWIEAFVKEKELLFIAEENKQIVGFIAGEETVGNVGYLWMLYVKKDYRGKGIATKLLKLAEKEFKKRKIKAIICYGYSSSKVVKHMLKKNHYKDGSKYTEYLKFIENQ